jgi:hypothetical protein
MNLSSCHFSLTRRERYLQFLCRIIFRLAIWHLDAYTVTNTDKRATAYFRIDHPGWLQRVKFCLPYCKITPCFFT